MRLLVLFVLGVVPCGQQNDLNVDGWGGTTQAPHLPILFGLGRMKVWEHGFLQLPNGGTELEVHRARTLDIDWPVPQPWEPLKVPLSLGRLQGGDDLGVQLRFGFLLLLFTLLVLGLGCVVLLMDAGEHLDFALGPFRRVGVQRALLFGHDGHVFPTLLLRGQDLHPLGVLRGSAVEAVLHVNACVPEQLIIPIQAKPCRLAVVDVQVEHAGPRHRHLDVRKRVPPGGGECVLDDGI
mmetsp:Transcript_99566/g.171403  ORF Transcript_99566/g.171403 Transcript_99566/m.171403 type:complete len:237 (+) Transcript_99566:1417-2127(+)